jgi:hypothetical protein
MRMANRAELVQGYISITVHNLWMLYTGQYKIPRHTHTQLISHHVYLLPGSEGGVRPRRLYSVGFDQEGCIGLGETKKVV